MGRNNLQTRRNLRIQFRAPRPSTPSAGHQTWSASPAKWVRAKTSPPPPQPDEVVLTQPTPTPSVTSRTSSKACLMSQATMTAHVAALIEKVRQLKVELKATQDMVATLLARPPTVAPLPPPPPPPPPQQGRTAPSKEATTPPSKKSFAAIAAAGPKPAAWKEVTRKTPKKAPLIVPGYPKINWEIIVELSSPFPTTLTNDAIRMAVNNILNPTGIKILLVDRTRGNNISMTTAPHTPASSVELYYNRSPLAFAPSSSTSVKS